MVLFQKTLALILSVFIAGITRAEEPKTAREYYERGMVREREKQTEDALADYSKAVELDPKFIDAWNSRSSLYEQQQEHGKAIADLTKIIEIKPGDYPALFNRGLIYEQIREYDKAIADYSSVLGDNADFSRSGSSKEEDLAHTYHYRGRVYQWYKRDYAKAVADFTKALELKPKIEMVHYRRGDAYHSLKDYARAEADYAIALESDPDYPNLLNSWAWQMATCPDPKFRDGKRAVKLAVRANVKFSFKHPIHISTLAAAYAESGRFAEAVKWQTEALERLGTKTPEQRKAMQKQLETYRAGRPFREDASK